MNPTTMQPPLKRLASQRRVPVRRYFLCSNLVALAICLGAPEAGAQGLRFSTEGAGPYFRAELGPSFFQEGRLNKFGGSTRNDVDFETGFAANAAIGYAFNKYLATDFEFGFVSAEIDSVKGFFVNDNTVLYNAPFLANLTLSYPIPRTIVTPYIGAGVGGSVSVFDTDGFGNSTDAVFGDDTDVVFAWQAYAGLRFELNKNVSLGIGYKYFSTDDSSFSYPPLFPGTGPDFRVGFEGVKTHSVLFTFQMKF
ncbi:MAG TPA: outer membrane beta-barrel protein [Verrucomicrobiae bacterium]|nr:outer membrane beta-barrel protein [Verrucomicrobiae bacterium]